MISKLYGGPRNTRDQEALNDNVDISILIDPYCAH